MKRIILMIAVILGMSGAAYAGGEKDFASLAALGRVVFLQDTLFTDNSHEYVVAISVVLPDVGTGSFELHAICLDGAGCEQANWSDLLDACASDTLVTNNPNPTTTSVTRTQCQVPTEAGCALVEGYPLSPTSRFTSVLASEGCQ